MKNIHVLPTDKPSRLQLNVNTKKLILFNNIQSNNESVHLITQNIYITSDEEIKEGDWYLNTEEKNGVMNPFYGKLYIANQSIKEVSYDYMPNLKKIILTTDVDLIKDGVQSIDDEFLEWFVKNPNCEMVEVFKERHHGVEFIDDYPKGFFDYQIIIPQEESKQFSLDEDVYENTGMIIPKLPKQEQETLEEAAVKYRDLKLPDDLYDGFIAGAKYQSKRMYSEEEVLSIIDKAFHMYASSHRYDAKEWFEENKKK
jgi:hypothetical protein